MTKNCYILLVSKSSLELYSESLKKAYRIDFLPQSVYDLEIISEASLSQQITTVIESNKLLQGNILIILTNSVLFQKDFPLSQDKKIKEDFLDNIPFENTCFISIPIQKTSERILAANKDLYISIKNTFTKKGFITTGVTLSPLLENSTTENSQTLFSIGLKKFESLKGDAFDDKKEEEENKDPETDTTETEYDDETKPEGKKKVTPRVIMLISVFGILILILFGLVLKTFIFPSETTTSPITPTPIEEAQSTNISPSQIPTSTQDLANLQLLLKATSIQIQTSQKNSSEAAQIQEGLKKEGFQNITISINNTIQSNQIIFSDKLSPLVKDKTLTYISSQFAELTEKIASESSNDILLTIADR